MLQNVKVLRFIKNYKEFCPRLFGNCKGNEIMDKEKEKGKIVFQCMFSVRWITQALVALLL